MRGCFAAVLIIVCLFFALVVGGAVVLGVFRAHISEPVAHHPGGASLTEAGQVEEGPRVERDGQADAPHPLVRAKMALLPLVFLLLVAGLILLAVLARVCRGSGARVRCERTRSVEQMHTLEELRTGIERMAGRVESLETILSARPGKQ